MSIRNYFLPHPHPHTLGHHRRAHLLQPAALASYLFFVLACFYTLSFTSVHLPGILGYATSINFDDLVSDTNNERLSQGLPTLTVNNKLNEAAAAKATYMFTHNFWAHVAPDGTTPWYFFTQSGYEYRFAGENLARDFNDSAAVVTAWMNSPSHRENMLNANYTDIGFAIVNGTLDGYETTLVVQLFGKPLEVNYIATVSPESAKVEIPVPQAPKLTVIPLVEQPQTPVTAITGSGRVLPAVDAGNATRGVTITLGLFLTMLLGVDGFYTFKNKLLRFSGNTVAHLVLLVLALVGIWYTNVGAIV